MFEMPATSFPSDPAAADSRLFQQVRNLVQCNKRSSITGLGLHRSIDCTYKCAYT